MSTQLFRSAVAAIAAGLLISSSFADDLWLVDFKAAKEQAAKEGKDILMEFTGSDWCPPCIALNEKVLSKDVFRDKMPEKYVLLKLDSPRDKSKQSAEEQEQYKQLAAEYKITGVPTIVLVDAKGRPFSKSVGYSGAEADEYVDDMLEKVELRTKRDEQFAKAENATGADKAKLLNEAVESFEGDLVVATYRDVVDQIVALDADNGLGLKEKYEGLIRSSEFKASLRELQQTPPNGDLNKIVEKIDELIHEKAPTGESLQEALFFKGQVLYGISKPKAKEALLAAAKAAPNSQMGKQIPLIIERAFADEEKDDAESKDDAEEKPAKKETKPAPKETKPATKVAPKK
ncbi:MAG: hypothetical protein FJ295_19320 [Planctomycetes bacterium]|nr:hypothetical protein [Planctomycetota bacterium]